METKDQVKLHGTWASMFAAMVELALKLKGVAYEYVQEDLLNKSPALLRYNPVHEKVPVLVHRGKPLAESSVILQYVDETWPEPPLLPSDPYERARIRFWVDFFHQKVTYLAPIMHMMT